MEKMILQAIVRPASKLKSILEVIRCIDNDIARVSVVDTVFQITAPNETESGEINISLLSEWFFHYKLDIPLDEAWTFSVSTDVLAGLLGYVHNDDPIIIRGYSRPDGSGDGYLKFSFVNIEQQVSHTHQMDVRGAEVPDLPDVKSFTDGLGFYFKIRPPCLTRHLDYCHRNHQCFSLTLSSAKVTVSAGQRYTKELTRDRDYTLINVPKEDGARSCELTMLSQDTEHFNRAVLRSTTILVMAPPPQMNPHPKPIIVAIVDEDLAWIAFPLF